MAESPFSREAPASCEPGRPGPPQAAPRGPGRAHPPGASGLTARTGGGRGPSVSPCHSEDVGRPRETPSRGAAPPPAATACRWHGGLTVTLSLAWPRNPQQLLHSEWHLQHLGRVSPASPPPHTLSRTPRSRGATRVPEQRPPAPGQPRPPETPVVWAASRRLCPRHSWALTLHPTDKSPVLQPRREMASLRS